MQQEHVAHMPLPALSENGETKLKAKGLLKYLGPAFVVSVAYMDPGNTWERTH